MGNECYSLINKSKQRREGIMSKKRKDTLDFIEVLKENGMFFDGTETVKKKTAEINSPQEFVERFHKQLVAISEPEHFIKMIELLNQMNICGALVYTTGDEKERGVFILHSFNTIKYDEEDYIVSFLCNAENNNDCNAFGFSIPVEKMEDVHGYISNEDDGQGDFYCLNIYMLDGNINIVWNC